MCLESPKLISRKIWVIEKSWNFHTVSGIVKVMFEVVISAVISDTYGRHPRHHPGWHHPGQRHGPGRPHVSSRTAFEDIAVILDAIVDPKKRQIFPNRSKSGGRFQWILLVKDGWHIKSSKRRRLLKSILNCWHLEDECLELLRDLGQLTIYPNSPNVSRNFHIL